MSRVPPHNVQAERSLLGAILQRPALMDDVKGIVTTGDFYVPAHLTIFAAIANLYQNGLPIELASLGDALCRDGGMELAGGQPALISMYNDAPSTASKSAIMYSNIIVDHARLRDVIRVCSNAVDDAYALPLEVSDFVADLQAQISSIEMPIGTGALPDGLWLIKDFMNRPETQRPQWVIRGLLRVGWRVVLVAVEGFGKSMVLHQIALCGAWGIHPFVPNVEIPPISTLVIDCENPEDRLDVGFELITDRMLPVNPEQPAAWLWSQPAGINLRDRRDCSRLEAVIAHVRPQVVCAGPVYKTFMSKSGESHAEVAREIQDVWDNLRTRYGFALVLEAHAAKGSNGTRELQPDGSALWLRWSEFGLKGVRSGRNRDGEHKYYDVGRFRLDRITDHGWPDHLERSDLGLPWAASWDSIKWQEYISGDPSALVKPPPRPPGVLDIQDDDPF